MAPAHFSQTPSYERSSGLGAPGGAGTSRVGQVSNLCGHGQPGTAAKLPKPMSALASGARNCGNCGTVPPLLWGAKARRGSPLGVAACVCTLVLPAAAGAGHGP